MTIIEQRKHERFPLVRQPAGEFWLQTPASKYPIKIIKDISSSGIRVYSDIYLTSPMRVAVEYVESTLKLEVNGIVAWSTERAREADDEHGPGGFIIGIQLLSPVLLMVMSGTY